MRRVFRRSALALIAGLAALFAAACSKPKAAPAKPADQPLTLTVARLETRPLTGGLTASGVLVSREEAAVTPQLSGYRVNRVFVDQDAYVRKGQPLAQLDDTLLRAQIEQQKAFVAQQKVAADRADQEAARVAGLDNQGVLPEEQILERRLAARSAHAAVAQAVAQLNDSLTRDALMTVRAPVSGLVLERDVRPGDASSTATVMFRIARDDLIELNAELPESDLARVKPGDHADVELPSGAHVTGVVRLISPQIDQATKLGHARVLLPVRADLRPGGYGRAVFTEVSRPTVVAPEAAVHFDADGASLMVVDANNRVHRTPIETGQHSQGYVELLRGPPAGSLVALGGSAFVLDGDKVRPVLASSAPARVAEASQ